VVQISGIDKRHPKITAQIHSQPAACAFGFKMMGMQGNNKNSMGKRRRVPFPLIG